MKQLNMRFKPAIILFLVLTFTSISAFAFERTEKITKNYKVTAATAIEVVNKYGNIQIIPWEKDSVKIMVDLTVRSNSPDRLEKIYNNVDFDFINTPGFITAKTIIGSRTTSVWTDLSTLTKTMFSNGSNITIDYVIYAPSKSKMIIENRYGDIFTGKLAGNVLINLSHGGLKSSLFLGNLDLTLKYGNAVIREIASGKITCEYSDFNLEKANQLSIDSKSGNIDIFKVNNLKIKARRGNYFVNEVNFLDSETFFTTLTFAKLNDKLYMNCKYGNLSVEHIGASFKKIDLDINYGDVNLTFAETSTYAIDVTHKNSTITFPKSKALLNTSSSDSDEKQKVTTGQIGNGKSQIPKLIARMERGSLNLYSK